MPDNQLQKDSMYNQQYRLKTEGQIIDVLRPKLDESMEASQSQNMPIPIIYKVRWYQDSNKIKGKRRISYIESGFAKFKYPYMVINFYDKHLKINHSNIFSTLQNDAIPIKYSEQEPNQEFKEILKEDVFAHSQAKSQCQKQASESPPISKEQLYVIKEQSQQKGNQKKQNAQIEKEKSKQEEANPYKRSLRSGKQTLAVIEKQDNSSKLNKRFKKNTQNPKTICDFDNLIKQRPKPRKVIVKLQLTKNQNKYVKAINEHDLKTKSCKKKNNSLQNVQIKSEKNVSKKESQKQIQVGKSTLKTQHQYQKQGIFDIIIKRQLQNSERKMQKYCPKSSSSDDSLISEGNKPNKMRKAEEKAKRIHKTQARNIKGSEKQKRGAKQRDSANVD